MAAPTPRSLPMAAQNARPDSFRISVFDAAVKLGITNPTVAGWMFDEPVLEEGEEDERANPGLSSSASEDSMASPTYPFTPSNTDPAMAYSAHSSFDAHLAAKQSSEVDYHSLEQYHGSSPATPLAKPNTIGKLRKAPPPRPVSPIHYFDEPPLAAPEKTTKKKKKDKKEKERDTDSDIVVEKKKKDKDIDDGEGKKKGFMKRGITFRLRSKERKEAEASMPRTRSPSPPPMPPVPLPIAQRFASHAAPETRRSPSPVRGRRLSPPWRNESASDAPSNKSSFELPGETYVPPPHVQPDPVSVRRTPSPSPPQHMLDVLEEYYGTELVPKSRRSSPQPPPAPLAYHAPPAMVSYQPGDIIPSTSIIPPTAPLNIRSRSPGPSSSDNLAVSTISSDARSPSPSPYIVPTPSTSPHASRTEFTSTYTTTQPTPLVAPTPVPRRVEFVAQPLPRPTVQTMNLHTPPSSAETSPDNLTPRAASPQRRSPPHRANPTMVALTRQVSPTTSSESGHGSGRRTSPPTAAITRQISPPTPVDPVHAHIRLAAPPSHQKMPSSERFLSPRRPPPPPVMTGGGTSLKLLRPSARVGALPPSPRAPTAPLPSTPTNMPLPPRRSASTSPLPRSPYGPAHTTLPPRSTSPLGGPHAAAFPLPPPGLAPGFPSQPRSRGTSPYPPSSPLPATPISRGVSPAPGANGLRRGQTPAFPVRPVGRAPSVIGRPATADQVPAAFMREEPQYLAPPEVYDPPSFIPPARPRPPKPSVYRGGYESDDAESRYSVASKYSRYSRYSTGDAEGAEAVGASFMEIEQQRVDGREKLVQRVAEGSSRPAPPPDRSGYF